MDRAAMHARYFASGIQNELVPLRDNGGKEMTSRKKCSLYSQRSIRTIGSLLIFVSAREACSYFSLV